MSAEQATLAVDDSTVTLPEGIMGPFEVEVDDPLSQALIKQILRTCDRAEDAPKGSIVLFRLRGKPTYVDETNVNGMDIHLANQWERALRRLENLPTMTIAAVTAPCPGPGLALLLTTDYRIVAPDVRLQLSRIGNDILPSMALHRLVNQVGVANSRRMILLGAERRGRGLW